MSLTAVIAWRRPRQGVYEYIRRHRESACIVDVLSGDTGALYTLELDAEASWQLVSVRVDDLTMPASSVSRRERWAVEQWADNTLAWVAARWAHEQRADLADVSGERVR